ncbi:hypothetical protein B484DRAFT_458395, partial [Ochromonadaceae sp. CCMP2298]
MRKEASGEKGIGERNGMRGKAYTIHATPTRPSDPTRPKNKHASVHGPSFFLLMMLDGIGLAMITGSTILEGVVYWKNYYHLFWQAQTLSVFLWISGRTFQVIGLVWLLGFAATFQLNPRIEHIGMAFLTTGPLLNLTACFLFRDPADPDLLFNREWLSNELLELSGMLILDLSYIDVQEYYVFLIEAVGFFTLVLAATVEFEYKDRVSLPAVDVRLDLVHCSEAIGLGALTVVAFGLYKIHEAKEAERRRKRREARRERLSISGINAISGLSNGHSGVNSIHNSNGHRHEHQHESDSSSGSEEESSDDSEIPLMI